MENQYTRTTAVLGEDAIKKLNNSHVAVFGVGGVGSYTVEALARAGVGKIDVIDNDTFNVTNINRQLYATHKTIFSVEIVTDFNMKDLQSNKIMLYAIAIVGCLIAVVIISILVVIYKKRTKKKVPISYVPQTEDILPLPDQDQSQIPDQRQN